jgi:adenylate cyclase
MALFGLEVASGRACIQALSAARTMFARLDDVNNALAGDLDAPLRMGIGIHPAVVGEIGYGRTSKTYGCELVVSDKLVAAAGLELADLPSHELVVEGRRASVGIRTVTKACDLPNLHV